MTLKVLMTIGCLVAVDVVFEVEIVVYCSEEADVVFVPGTVKQVLCQTCGRCAHSLNWWIFTLALLKVYKHTVVK